MKDKKQVGYRVNIYLPSELKDTYFKVKKHLDDNGKSISQVVQEYLVNKEREIR